MTFALLVSYLLHNHLSFVFTFQATIGVLGAGLTMPIVFYISIFWHELSYCNKIFHFVLLACCLYIGILNGYNDYIDVF